MTSHMLLFSRNIHCKKKKKSFSDFLTPAGMSLIKLPLAGNNVPNPSSW